ncbi:MAG: membrane protein insertase YidC [Chloroherpetonaceae bacterium]|nr:membrane protein insertase YidC [Chloroherpetonaceae bacterium]
MDRNTFIGLLLIALIVLVWMQLISPPPKPPEKTRFAPIDSSVVIHEDSVFNAKKQAETLRSMGEFGAAAAGVERLITVETDDFTAKISTKGASLISYVQKHHLNYKKEPFNLVSSPSGATSIFFQSNDGRNIRTADLYFTLLAEDSIFTVSGNAKLELPFILNLDNGKSIQITYSFNSAGYTIGYTPLFKGFENGIFGNEIQVEWAGGIMSSEKDKVDESANSYANAYQAGSLVKLDASSKDEKYKEQPSGKTKWVSVQSKFFCAALISGSDGTGAYLEGKHIAKSEKDVFEDYTVALRQPLVPNLEMKENFTIYLGPLDYKPMKALGVDLEKTMDFGWEWVTRPFAEWLILPVFNFMREYIPSFGLIIIIFALFIKLVTYPLTIASTNSMKKMASLQPQLQEIQERFKDNPTKLQSELGKVYRDAGVNPVSGCLPVLLQLPLLYALYNVFKASIQLRQQSFLWAQDLSVPDSIFDFPFSIPIYGDHIAVYPILMGVTIWVQQKVTPTTAPTEQMKIFMYIFPAMMLLFFNNMPAGLGLYYLMFNVFGIVQQIYINKTTPPAPVVHHVHEPKKKKKK